MFQWEWRGIVSEWVSKEEEEEEEKKQWKQQR
jgi:hypothetical protein